MREAATFDKSLCLRGIEDGVRHMHSLGLVHNDLNLSNIMMDGNRPVVINFDSCKREGDVLGLKGGTFDWQVEGTVYAMRENDYFSLSKICEFPL
jgi:serine/threonine protein kinase